MEQRAGEEAEGGEMTKRRKKFFTTLTEAKKYLRDEYTTRTVLDPRKEDVKTFKVKHPVGGRKYFVGTGVEFDFVRFT